MGDNSAIEWTEATWNPIRGCSRVSAGCFNCYAEGVAQRFSGPGQPYEGLTKLVNGHPAWTGKVRLVPDMLDAPLRWKRPRRIFVNSMSDLFHEKVPDSFIADVFGVMEKARHHTFQVLTKRPERMLKLLREWHSAGDGWSPAGFPHVWLGVSVEDQATANERIPLLLQTPAAVRWISAEPLLGPISFDGRWVPHADVRVHENELERIDWVVVGGESGRRARPMHPDWARDLRDQCSALGVPFFFKQWGEWLPGENYTLATDAQWQDGCTGQHPSCIPPRRGGEWRHSTQPGDPGAFYLRVGKMAAGRLLDGREWNEYPPCTVSAPDLTQTGTAKREAGDIS